MSEPRYWKLTSLERDYYPTEVVCQDCGARVLDRDAHTRFHSILSGHAWMLACLKVSHLAAVMHDKYDVVERIDTRQFDSWAPEVFAEGTAKFFGADTREGE